MTVIVSVCVPYGFSRLIPYGNDTLQTSTPTYYYVHGRQSVLFVCVQEEQVKSDNVVEHKGSG